MFAPVYRPPAGTPRPRTGVVLVQPIEVAPGMQVMSASLQARYADCETFGCSWFLYGKEGFDEGKPFSHPAGVECGDFDRCTDENCPCPGRVLQWPERLANGKLRRWGHKMPDFEAPARYRVTDHQRQRLVDFSEYIDRTREGVDTIARIMTKGL